MKPGLLVAAAIIIVSNAIVLVGVARNRAGVPVQTIQLTHRELPTGYREKEDTGVSLRLNWSQYGIIYPEQNSWLNQAKLESIGFDTAAALRDAKHQPLARPAYVVFEYNGPAWEQWLQKAQQTKFAGSPSITDTQSRLFAVDAAKTPETLLLKYPDRSKYLIVRGVIRAFVNTWDPIARKAANRLEGSVSEALPQNIHVPPPLANTFARTPYIVTLAYGRRFEPWVVAGP